MPARSIVQQKLFGAALSVKRGNSPRNKASKKVLSLVDTLPEKDLEAFATMPDGEIPYRVKKEQYIRNLVREELNRIFRQR